MARINAGSTLVNQYAPPFVVSDYVAQGWELQWNETLLAFEAVDPNLNVVESGFDSIEVALYPNVTQQVFVVPWEAASKKSIYVTIQGLKQHQDAYTVITNTGSGTTTVTLSETVSSEDVEILGLQASGGASIEVFGPVNADADVPNTAQAAFDLGWLAASKQSLLVSIDGVKQDTSAYSIAPNSNATDTTLTFTESPSMGVTTPVTVVNGGTGYSVGNVITLTGGTFTTAATLTVTSETGGVIDPGGVSISNAGVYTVFPTGTLTSTGAGNSDATFTVTKDSQRIEVIGIQTAGETPASPVNVVSAYGLDTASIFSPFASKTLSGDTQILNFKALEAGTNVTITDNTNRLTIDATQLTVSNLGAGGTNLAVIPGGTDDVELRGLAAGTRMLISEAGGVITAAYNIGRITATEADDPLTVAVANKLVSITGLSATLDITLPDPGAVGMVAGDTITVKNQTASTFDITLTPASGLIDTAATYVLNTAFGYVTLYNDGTNYFIIAEG